MSLSACNRPTDAHAFERAATYLASGPSLWTGLGKSGHAASLLAATAATCGLPARYCHVEDLLHGELASVSHIDTIFAISWSGLTEQIWEVAKRGHVPAVLLSRATEVPMSDIDVLLVTCPGQEDVLLSGVPAESVLGLLALGYEMIATATTHDERRRRLLANHPHGAIGAGFSQAGADPLSGGTGR